MYIMILSIMYYFTNFGDLCDSGSFHLYGFPGSTTHYDKKFILLLLTSFISEIKLFLFLFFLFLITHYYGIIAFDTASKIPHLTMHHLTMDHLTMDHLTMDHPSMDHLTMDHLTMDHLTMHHLTMHHLTRRQRQHSLRMTINVFLFGKDMQNITKLFNIELEKVSC